MGNESDLYRLTEKWMSEVEGGCPSERFNCYRKKFSDLEQKAFGEVFERCKNETAMKYDAVRNGLVGHSGKYPDKKLNQQFLKQAKTAFHKIEKPAD